LNSLPLALAYYSKREMNILRYKWVVDQLATRSFRDLTGGASEIVLLVSGRSVATKLLEENGFHLDGKPVQYGHVMSAHYILGNSPAPHTGPGFER